MCSCLRTRGVMEGGWGKMNEFYEWLCTSLEVYVTEERSMDAQLARSFPLGVWDISSREGNKILNCEVLREAWGKGSASPRSHARWCVSASPSRLPFEAWHRSVLDASRRFPRRRQSPQIWSLVSSANLLLTVKLRYTAACNPNERDWAGCGVFEEVVCACED